MRWSSHGRLEGDAVPEKVVEDTKNGADVEGDSVGLPGLMLGRGDSVPASVVAATGEVTGDAADD